MILDESTGYFSNVIHDATVACFGNCILLMTAFIFVYILDRTHIKVEMTFLWLLSAGFFIVGLHGFLHYVTVYRQAFGFYGLRNWQGLVISIISLLNGIVTFVDVTYKVESGP